MLDIEDKFNDALGNLISIERQNISLICKNCNKHVNVEFLKACCMKPCIVTVTGDNKQTCGTKT